MFNRCVIILAMPLLCLTIGCNGGSVALEDVSFDSGELKDFKQRLVDGVEKLIDEFESGGRSALFETAPEIQRDISDNYPQNAGSAENAVSQLIDRLDTAIDNANEATDEQTEEILKKLLEDINAL